MPGFIAGPQRLTICPPEYQKRIAHAGGFNKYGEPNFKLVWGEAWSTRAGGFWEHTGFSGYRDVYTNETPCWLLLEWKAPEEFGSPTSYYIQNYDEATGLQDLGEFPYAGRYQVMFILRDYDMRNGALVIDPMKLNGMLIDSIIPLMKLGQQVSYQRRAQAIKERRQREEEEQTRIYADARMDAQMAFGGAIFSSRDGRNSKLIEAKEELLRRGMVTAYRRMKAAGMGVSIMPNGPQGQ